MNNLNPERYAKIFSKRFNQLLKDYDGTYEQIAKGLGLKSKSNITKYANGTIIVNIIMFTKIADFFHVSPAWLIGLTDDKHYEFKN